MKKMMLSLAVIAGLLMICGSLLAHHGTGISYDQTKSVTITGTLTGFAWKNPHAYVQLDVKDDKGQIVHWSGEMNSPGVLKAAGWTKDTLKEGDQVTITLHPSKAGTPVGVVDRSKPVMRNGKQVLAAGGNNVD